MPNNRHFLPNQCKNIMTAPPASQKSIEHLYRLPILIAEKAQKEQLSQADIKRQLCTLLGFSRDHMYRVINARKGDNGFLSIAQLQTLMGYFSCSFESLITEDLLTTQGPGTELSDSVTGD